MDVERQEDDGQILHLERYVLERGRIEMERSRLRRLKRMPHPHCDNTCPKCRENRERRSND